MHHLPSLFSNFSLQFQIVPKTVPMHALPSLFSKVSLQFQNIVLNNVRRHTGIATMIFSYFSFKPFQIPSQCTIYRHFFRNLSAVPNRFKYRLNAPFSVLVFICFLCSSNIVSNSIRMHA